MSPISLTTLRDAKKPLRIKVTTTDIQQSKRNDPKNCMIAVACRRQQHATEVRIHKSRAYVRTGDTWTRYIVPEGASRELIVFDRGGSNEEFEFDLLAPSASYKLGTDRGNKPHPSGGRKRRNRPRIIVGTVRSDMESGQAMHIALGA